MTQIDNWREEYRKLMFELPVNSHIVYMENLITGEKEFSLRGTVIEKFIELQITLAKAEGAAEERKRIVEEIDRISNELGELDWTRLKYQLTK